MRYLVKVSGRASPIIDAERYVFRVCNYSPGRVILTYLKREAHAYSTERNAERAADFFFPGETTIVRVE